MHTGQTVLAIEVHKCIVIYQSVSISIRVNNQETGFRGHCHLLLLI